MCDMTHSSTNYSPIRVSWRIHMHDTPHFWHDLLQGGKNPYDALRCRSLSAKEPPITGLFCGKRCMKIRHPMGLRYPVCFGIHTYDRTFFLIYAYVCRDSFVCVTSGFIEKLFVVGCVRIIFPLPRASCRVRGPHDCVVTHSYV